MHFLFTTLHRCTMLMARAVLLAASLLAGIGIVDPGLLHAVAPASDGPRETVLRGEVVETACFVIGARRGEGHKQCALMGVRSGESLGVLDDQTKLLFVMVPDLTAGPEPNPLVPYVAQKVEVRGVTVERGGINGIMIRQVKAMNPPAKR